MNDKCAVIGNLVEHSLSPVIHATFARSQGALAGLHFDIVINSTSAGF
jgi:shikimate 5-dehydrogenase